MNATFATLATFATFATFDMRRRLLELCGRIDIQVSRCMSRRCASNGT
jgi:hypothetical protein